jgi:hypothetical protein
MSQRYDQPLYRVFSAGRIQSSLCAPFVYVGPQWDARKNGIDMYDTGESIVSMADRGS